MTMGDTPQSAALRQCVRTVLSTADLPGGNFIAGLILCVVLNGCPTPYELRHQDQWDSRDQIWLSEHSQVKLRAAQSRVFDTTVGSSGTSSSSRSAGTSTKRGVWYFAAALPVRPSSWMTG